MCRLILVFNFANCIRYKHIFLNVACFLLASILSKKMCRQFTCVVVFYLCQVGYPSQTNSPSCEYARIDFDCDEEFSMLLSSKLTV